MCVCVCVCVLACMHACMFVTVTNMHAFVCVYACMCVCVAKPVAVELRCHATALIFSFMDSFIKTTGSFYAPNFEKVGGHIGFGLSVCMYVCTYVCMYVFMFEISS